jgi:hypothetical protein
LEKSWQRLDDPVDDSLAANMSVIIAYKGWVNATTNGEATNEIVDWWREAAQHYANHSYRLAFNVFIEIGGLMCHFVKPKPPSCPVEDVALSADALNPLYERIVAAVQEVTPGRIVIMPPPGKLNRPSNLPDLKVPSKCGSYCMAEWHVAAAGPCSAASDDCPSGKFGLQWHGTDGTQAERKALADAVKPATEWSRGAGGLPVWVGAFMPGPWNHPERGDMSIAAQASYAHAYTCELERQGIPWAVLTAGAFIDETTSSGKWLSNNKPIRNAILSNNKQCLQSHSSKGAAPNLRLLSVRRDSMISHGHSDTAAPNILAFALVLLIIGMGVLAHRLFLSFSPVWRFRAVAAETEAPVEDTMLQNVAFE